MYMRIRHLPTYLPAVDGAEGVVPRELPLHVRHALQERADPVGLRAQLPHQLLDGVQAGWYRRKTVLVLIALIAWTHDDKLRSMHAPSVRSTHAPAVDGGGRLGGAAEHVAEAPRPEGGLAAVDVLPERAFPM